MSRNLNIVKYNELPQGGFAGIVEKQLVVQNSRVPQSYQRKTSNGLGDFIYLSMGHFKGNDGAPLHPHKNVDIVSFIYSGEIGHKGSLGDGTVIKAPGVQVQRAGVGMTHSEFSTSDQIAKFAQIWFRPPEGELESAYKDFLINKTGLTTVYGGNKNTFKSTMICKIGFLEANTVFEIKGKFVAALFDGVINIDNTSICENDLFEGEDLSFEVNSKVGLILIQENE